MYIQVLPGRFTRAGANRFNEWMEVPVCYLFEYMSHKYENVTDPSFSYNNVLLAYLPIRLRQLL